MAIDVIMPQMGESIAEGTIVKWLKKVGDKIQRDEPLFEISTDKVDAEIPAPASGVVVEILVPEGQTVPINTVVARIGEEGEVSAPTAQPQTAAAQVVSVAQTAAPVATATGNGAPLTAEELRRQRSSPLVRKIARENNIDITGMRGTGIGGRVTKDDILQVLQQPSVAAPATIAPVATPPVAAAITTPAIAVAPALPSVPAYREGDRVEVVPMTPIRRKTAEHMILSRRTSAHVTSVFEVDMTRIAKLRDEYKDRFFQRNGVKLTFTPFIVKATIDALTAWPVMNASIDGDNIVYKKDINIGMAVALDWGLIVPVIKNADEKSLLGLTRAVNDLANRARSKQLKPEEVQGGTFTITNPGIFGSLFGTPIISQPQVAIMGIGTIEKRLSVMEDDAIAIRSKAYFSISFDHRLIDGAVADQFMAHVKRVLENFTTTEL